MKSAKALTAQKRAVQEFSEKACARSNAGDFSVSRAMARFGRNDRKKRKRRNDKKARAERESPDGIDARKTRKTRFFDGEFTSRK